MRHMLSATAPRQAMHPPSQHLPRGHGGAHSVGGVGRGAMQLPGACAPWAPLKMTDTRSFDWGCWTRLPAHQVVSGAATQAHMLPTHLANHESEYLAISGSPAKFQAKLARGATAARASAPPHKTPWWCCSSLVHGALGSGLHEKPGAHRGGKALGSTARGAGAPPWKQLKIPGSGRAPQAGLKAILLQRNAMGDFNQTLAKQTSLVLPLLSCT